MLRGLKAKIGINLGVFFLIAMLAIDFVITLTAQRLLVRTEGERARDLGTLFAARLEDFPLWEESLPNPATPRRPAASVRPDRGLLPFYPG